MTVSDAWARSSPSGVTMGAAYFDITSVDDDLLVAVSVSSDVAARAEIHEVVKAMDMGDDEMHDHDWVMTGCMMMQCRCKRWMR